MSFPEPSVLKGTIADLKDIVSRSQSDNAESVRLLQQIESIVSDIESKANQRQLFVAAPVTTPVSV